MGNAKNFINKVSYFCLPQNQSTPEQLEKWMPLIKKYKIIGTYAQTEMGHGKFECILVPRASQPRATFIGHGTHGTLSARNFAVVSKAHTSELKAGFPLANFFARSDLFPLSVSLITSARRDKMDADKGKRSLRAKKFASD